MVIASLKFSFFDELKTMNERSIMDLLIPDEEGEITDEKSLAKLLEIAQDRSHALRLADGTNPKRDVFVEYSYDNDTLALIDNALKHGYSITKADSREGRGNCLDYNLKGPGLTMINSKIGLEGVPGARDDQNGVVPCSHCKQGRVKGANGCYLWNRDAIIAALQCTTEARGIQLLFLGALRSGYFDALKEMDENEILDLLAQNDKKTNITKLLEVARDQGNQHERAKKKKKREEPGIGNEVMEPGQQAGAVEPGQQAGASNTAGMEEMKQRIALAETQASTKDARIAELEALISARDATIAGKDAIINTNSETISKLVAKL